MRLRVLFFVGIAAAFGAPRAHAGAISVGPTLIELSAGKRIASVRVQNTGPQETIVQLETVSWTQTAGGDQYTASEDLLATPTVFQLAPGEARDVRVGLRSEAPALTERSFRLYVREVVATRAEVAAQLSFAIRIGVPVFVHGARNTRAALSWSIADTANDCRHLAIQNSGGTRVHALRVEYLDGDVSLWHSTSPAYILAGARHVIEPADCLPAQTRGNPRLRLTTDDGTSIVPAAPPS